MQNFIGIAQVVISIVLVALILLQQRGTGLSGVFGGTSEFYSTRRGLEKIIFYITVAAAFLFIATSVLAFVLR